MPPASPRLLHIACARQDVGWVETAMIPGLGLEDGQYWTRAEDDASTPQLLEVQAAVKGCRYTVLVASRAAKVDDWAQFASVLAQHAGLEEGKPRLILIARDFEPGSARAKELLPLWQQCLGGFDCSDPERTALAFTALREQLRLAQNVEVDAPPSCPYPGLRMFGEGDAASHFDRPELFFGRDAVGDAVVAGLERDRRVLLVGPSGCGKSSLVRARVLPALRRRTPELAIAVARPGADPDAALRAALVALDARLGPATDAYLDADEPTTARTKLTAATAGVHGLVYLDQLEEAFVGSGPAHAAASARCFARIAAIRHIPDLELLLAMRADFFGDLMRSAAWDTLKDHRVELAPLRGAALRLAITRPAEAVGVYVEADLVERLVREADMDRAAEALPLLQVALVQLWEQREWRYLSLASYARIADGERRGLDVVLARHADASLAALTEPLRVVARRVLIDLVHLGEGRPDTRRRRSLRVLRRAGDDIDGVSRVLAHLSERRLIVPGATAVLVTQAAVVALPTPAADGAERHADLAHDTLINGWPAFTAWIAERRDDLRTQRRLEARAAGGGLLADSELGEFTRWVAWLTTPPGRALGASDELLDLTRRSIETRRRRKLRIVVTAASVMVVLAAIAAVALYQRQRAVVARDAEARSRGRETKLVNHLAYDLPEMLQAMGQPSAMRSSAKVVDDYFRSLQDDVRSLDRSRKQRLAAGLVSLANVYVTLGEIDQARVGFDNALRLGEALARAQPKDPSVRRYLYNAHMGRGALFANLNAWDESLAEAQQARMIIEGFAMEPASDPRWTLDVADAWLLEATASAHVEGGDPLVSVERAEALLKPLVAAAPTEPEAALALAKAYRLRRQFIDPAEALGEAQISTKINELLKPLVPERFDARVIGATSEQTIVAQERGGLAAIRFAAALPVRADRDQLRGLATTMYETMQRERDMACIDRYVLARIAPRELDPQQWLFRCSMLTAAAHRARGDARSADEAVTKAWQTQQQMSKAFPDNPAVVRDGGLALALAGMNARETGDLQRARTYYGDSLERARIRAKAVPVDTLARDELALALVNLAEVEADLGAYADVSAHLDEAIELCRVAVQGPCSKLVKEAADTPRAPTWLPLALQAKVTATTGLSGRVARGATCAMYLRPLPANASDGCPRAVVSCNGWRVLGTDLTMGRLAVTGARGPNRGACTASSRLDLASGRLHLNESSLLGAYTVDAVITRP